MASERIQLVIDTCLLAGRIMIESGSEMYRVEDTITRIAHNAGVENSVIYTTPTGLFFSVKGSAVSELRQINSRTINLEKVQRVNTLSRKFAEKQISLRELHDALEDVDQNTPLFPLWLQFLASVVVSSTMMILFSGVYDWNDLIISGVIGGLGFLANYYINIWTRVKFLSELVAAFLVGFIAYLAVQLHLGQNINNVLIGAIMPLVPGVPLTNALRDMFAGHLMTGTLRALEAGMTACAIGAGIGLAFRIFF
ncbi:threonine/serine exporter family protein [Lapidilactobacillus bayanensis]|uniref:threonine/serine exporter family protein n=1 Tax=Lapidilactobacillus bayanensis TaxID=2485998 RepID=UPI000F7B15ED|nr:threonine/serine exporter family protein [Lapidilactobacillus bayanensis]